MVSHFHNKRNDRKGKTMKYLVTGGCGFVGSHLVDELVKNGHTITVIDNMSNGNNDNLSECYGTGNVEIINKDINWFM